MTDDITPLIITFDEAANIKRTLDQLTWARRIVVIDSGSTDGTLDLLARYPQVEIIRRPFDSFAEQCNFGLAQVRSPWTLSLDADYVLSDGLVRELEGLRDEPAVSGYRASFIYDIHGRSLRGALYPPRTVLYRTSAAQYENEGHGHRVRVAGDVRQLAHPIHHDDRKPLARWVGSQQRYASAEAEHLLNAPTSALSPSDRVRRTGWAAPILVFGYVLVIKGCILDGWPGWLYALQRLFAEVLIALELADRRLSRQAHQ